MFKSSAKYPLVFKIPESDSRKRSSIHTLFMRFEIIIIFIDKNNEIYEITNLKPWKLYIPKKPAKYIIEIDKKEFKKYELNIKDIVKLNSK